MHPAIRRAVTLENGSMVAVSKRSGISYDMLYSIIIEHRQPHRSTITRITKAYASHKQFYRSDSIGRVQSYLSSKYKKSSLSTAEAVKELQLSGGIELGSIMFSGRLRDLSIESVARYTVLFT